MTLYEIAVRNNNYRRELNRLMDGRVAFDKSMLVVDEAATFTAGAWSRLDEGFKADRVWVRENVKDSDWYRQKEVEFEIKLEMGRVEREQREQVQKWKTRLRRGGWSARFWGLYINLEKVMSDVKSIGAERALSPMEIAQREVAEEKRQAAVVTLKQLLKKRDAAATVLANIDREIRDANEALEQGNKV